MSSVQVTQPSRALRQVPQLATASSSSTGCDHDSPLAIAAAAIVERTRREQGLPPTITNPAAIERLATLMATAGGKALRPELGGPRRATVGAPVACSPGGAR